MDELIDIAASRAFHLDFANQVLRLRIFANHGRDTFQFITVQH